MSIQSTQFTDIASPPFDPRYADKTNRRRRGRSDKKQHERHIDLKMRLRSHGGDFVTDADLLELMLLQSSPQEDMQSLADKLMVEFGDFASALCADTTRLEALVGASTAQNLKLIHIASKRLAKARIADRPLISSWDAVLTYCRTALAHKETEEFHVLFLDRRNMLIADEVMGVGTVDHVPVYPREVLKRALELNSCAIILVHNHPSGDPTPSESDVEMTKLIKQAADSLAITLHDHLIIGASGETSFVSKGLL